MNSGKVILGIVAGAAAGYALGVLFAPDKGKNTRQNINKRANDYTGNLKSKLGTLVDGFSERISNATAEAGDLKQKGKSLYKEAKNEAKALYDEAKSNSKSTMNDKSTAHS